MEALSTSKTQSQSSLQHRQRQQQQQAKFFRLAVPIALVLHGIAIGGVAMMGQHITEVPTEEVEIIADNSTKKDEPQPIDSTGQGGDFAGGGGGGGNNKFSLLQTEGGTTDGNNVSVLGNPFITPEISPVETSTSIPESRTETPVTPENIPEESKKTIDPKKPIESPKTESKEFPKNSQVPSKPGQLDGKKEGKGDKGDPKGGQLNPNTSNGVGRKGGTGVGKGNGNGSGTGNGNGNGRGDGNGTGKMGKAGSPGAKPGVNPLTSEKPILKPIVQSTSEPKPVAIVSPKPVSKKGPKCREGCDAEYLGVEGRFSIRQTIDRDGNVIEATLVNSTGNAEADRKAIEAAKRRKYEPSNEGYNTLLPVTSQQEGSEFTKQQEERRRQEQADRDRTSSGPEPKPREAEPQPTIVAPIAPIAEPISKPVVEPSAEPTKPIPEPIAPSIPEPIAPEPLVEPPAPIVPEPVAPQSVVPEPIGPEPTAPIPAPPESKP